MISGFMNIDKPEGMTSSDVVCIVRGVLSKAVGERCKAGHLGTLDPAASGVLPVAVGKATRLFDYLLRKRKTYTARFRFGETTDTLDRAGKITKSGGRIPDFAEIKAAATLFEGFIDQIPPDFSAKSVNGKRAYDLAREGKTVSLTPKTVFVKFDDIKPAETAAEFDFVITCGSGTYIRALARDIAAAAGTVGYVTALRRISSGAFDLGNAVTLEELKTNPTAHILPTDFPLADFTAMYFPSEHARLLKNGVPVAAEAACSVTRKDNAEDDAVAVYDEEGAFVGMGAIDDDKMLTMRAVLC